MMADLSIDAAGAVHALDMLKARGEVLDGIAAEDGGKAWLHKEVFRRIRARSLAKARAETKPVELSEYQTFLIGLQGVGPVGGERYDGEDGVMRVIEQLEASPCLPRYGNRPYCRYGCATIVRRCSTACSPPARSSGWVPRPPAARRRNQDSSHCIRRTPCF